MADDDLANLADKVEAQLMEMLRKEGQRLSDAQVAALRSLEQSPEDTGNLEASCNVVDGDGLEVIVQAGGELTTKEVRDGSGEPYDYAEAFEYGTKHQPARPFFWPTVRAMESEINENIEKAINEVLK